MSASKHPGAAFANEADPYDSARGNFPRSPTVGHLVAVLRPTRTDRGLKLIPERSRCIRSGEIHELILTDEHAARPGSTVDRVAYLGFAEISTGGLLVAGDVLTIDGGIIGNIAGYDETHMPNHLNIVVVDSHFASGFDRGLLLGSPVRFEAQFGDRRFEATGK